MDIIKEKEKKGDLKMKEYKEEFKTEINVKLINKISKKNGKEYKACIIEFKDGTIKYIGFENDYKLLFISNS